MSNKTPQWDDKILIGAIKIFACLPLWLVTAIGAFLATIISYVPLKWASAYRVALVNIMLCYPELSYREAAKLARRSLQQTGRTLTEFSHVWTRPPEQSLTRISQVTGLAPLQRAYAEKRPVLLLTLHQSSWELPNLLLAQEAPMTVFYQTHGNEALNTLVTRARESTGSKLVPANTKGIKAGLAAMARAEAVAILVDHNPASSNNPQALLFNHLVRTSNLAHKLIQRYEPLVFFVGCHRGAGKHKDVRVYIEPAPESIYSDNETLSLSAMNEKLAELINRYPEQYHWTYKRFRRINGVDYKVYHKRHVPALKRARRANKALKLEDLM